jgi:hypothetical protein
VPLRSRPPRHRSLSILHFFSLNRESLTLPPWLAVAPHSLPHRSPPFERPFTAHPSKQPPSDEPSAQPPSSAARSFTKPTAPSLLEPAESLVPELHHSVESEHHHAAVPFFRRARAIPALAATPESRQLVRDPPGPPRWLLAQRPTSLHCVCQCPAKKKNQAVVR